MQRIVLFQPSSLIDTDDALASFNWKHLERATSQTGKMIACGFDCQHAGWWMHIALYPLCPNYPLRKLPPLKVLFNETFERERTIQHLPSFLTSRAMFNVWSYLVYKIGHNIPGTFKRRLFYGNLVFHVNPYASKRITGFQTFVSISKLLLPVFGLP